MGWHRSGTVQELNTPARREQAQSPRGAAMHVLRCVHTGVCSRGVHSGVCAQVREERTQGFCK